MRAALAMFAVSVQTLLPLVLAADIAAAASAPPICSVPAGGRHDPGRHDPGGACPICAALAATGAIAAPSPPTLPLPRFAGADAPAAVAQVAPAIHFTASYRSRAPPVA